MTPETDKLRCTACNHQVLASEILHAPNPFYASDIIDGCPECFSINSLECLCDEPGCDMPGTCGWPSPDGYRHTCGKHWREKP